MLTFEILFAVLQGLPFYYLDHLDREWQAVCKDIFEAIQAGFDAITALKHAIRRTSPGQLRVLRNTFQKAKIVMDVHGLSYRQKETLVALRMERVASLASLNRSLMQDPPHLHRRLKSLVRKGLVVKFVRPDGVFYYAVEKSMQHTEKAAAYRMVMDLIQTLTEEPQPNSLSKFGINEQPAIVAMPAITAMPAKMAIPAMGDRVIRSASPTPSG